MLVSYSLDLYLIYIVHENMEYNVKYLSRFLSLRQESRDSKVWKEHMNVTSIQEQGPFKEQ